MRLYIENDAPGKNICTGQYSRVYLLDENDERTDISDLVRAADIHMHVGEIVTATLEVFVTGVSARAEAESVLLRHIKPRRFGWLRRKWRDVTTFGRGTGVREYLR